MRFPKPTREAIYQSTGQPVRIDWPKKRGEPKVGHRYTVQASQQAGTSAIIVVGVDGSADAWRATVKLTSDSPNLLGKSSGYVSSPSRSIAVSKAPEGGQFRNEFEPEAVGKEDLDALVREQRSERRERLRSRIQTCEEALNDLQADDDFVGHSGAINFQRNMLRKLERQLSEVDSANKVAA